jgi:hypothetical protein
MVRLLVDDHADIFFQLTRLSIAAETVVLIAHASCAHNVIDHPTTKDTTSSYPSTAGMEDAVIVATQRRGRQR